MNPLNMGCGHLDMAGMIYANVITTKHHKKLWVTYYTNWRHDMSRYIFNSSGELTHCGTNVTWEDCNKKHCSCYVSVCVVCGIRDFDCESEEWVQQQERNGTRRNCKKTSSSKVSTHPSVLFFANQMVQRELWSSIMNPAVTTTSRRTVHVVRE